MSKVIKINRLEEKNLIKRLQQGQEAAFQILVRQYQSRLMAIAWGITLDHEESLEIVQDVFLSVHRNINEFRGDAGLMTWMRKVTINLCLNWKRRWKRRFRWHHVPLESEENILPRGETPPHSPESHYLGREMEQNIMEHVARLPEKIRTVFILKTVEEMSYEAIAQLLNIKPGTVSSRLYHARKSLASALEREAS
ncbi:MAG: sigma-70 family RNA polymerase sigma factor [Desulfobacterium sp.]